MKVLTVDQLSKVNGGITQEQRDAIDAEIARNKQRALDRSKRQSPNARTGGSRGGDFVF